MQSIRQTCNGHLEAQAEDERAMIFKQIAMIPEDLREVILLRYYDNLTYEEMAQWMEWSRPRLQRKSAGEGPRRFAFAPRSFGVMYELRRTTAVAECGLDSELTSTECTAMEQHLTRRAVPRTMGRTAECRPRIPNCIEIPRISTSCRASLRSRSRNNPTRVSMNWTMLVSIRIVNCPLAATMNRYDRTGGTLCGAIPKAS